MKFQDPKPKNQTNPKFQGPKFQTHVLEIGAWNLFGTCLLEFY